MCSFVTFPSGCLVSKFLLYRLDSWFCSTASLCQTWTGTQRYYKLVAYESGELEIHRRGTWCKSRSVSAILPVHNFLPSVINECIVLDFLRKQVIIWCSGLNNYANCKILGFLTNWKISFYIYKLLLCWQELKMPCSKMVA